MLYGIDDYGNIVLLEDEILDTIDEYTWQDDEDFMEYEPTVRINIVLPGQEDEENPIYQTFDYC